MGLELRVERTRLQVSPGILGRARCRAEAAGSDRGGMGQHRLAVLSLPASRAQLLYPLVRPRRLR